MENYYSAMVFEEVVVAALVIAAVEEEDALAIEEVLVSLLDLWPKWT